MTFKKILLLAKFYRNVIRVRKDDPTEYLGNAVGQPKYSVTKTKKNSTVEAEETIL